MWTEHREQVFAEMLGEFRGNAADFLEIGSCEGASAIWLLEHILTNPDSTLASIDIQAIERMQILMANLEESGHAGRARIHRLDSKDLRKHFDDETFDFVYVDGAHDAPTTLRDVMAAFLICKPGGLIGCDDYRLPNLEKGSHPGDAIDAFLAIYHQHVDVVHNGYQLWFRRID